MLGSPTDRNQKTDYKKGSSENTDNVNQDDFDNIKDTQRGLIRDDEKLGQGKFEEKKRRFGDEGFDDEDEEIMFSFQGEKDLRNLDDVQTTGKKNPNRGSVFDRGQRGSTFAKNMQNFADSDDDMND